jgi:hypothetical protein
MFSFFSSLSFHEHAWVPLKYEQLIVTVYRIEAPTHPKASLIEWVSKELGLSYPTSPTVSEKSFDYPRINQHST